jgi:Gpi18-like mannosyltransferase
MISHTVQVLFSMSVKLTCVGIIYLITKLIFSPSDCEKNSSAAPSHVGMSFFNHNYLRSMS